MSSVVGTSEYLAQVAGDLAQITTTPDPEAFVGERLAIVQEVRWGPVDADGARSGTFSITVPGKPVTFEGTARLEPTASGSVIDHAGDLSVRIPLLGARIEKEAAPAILEALDVQARVGRAWLTR